MLPLNALLHLLQFRIQLSQYDGFNLELLLLVSDVFEVYLLQVELL